MVITNSLLWDGRAYKQPEIISAEIAPRWFEDHDPMITIKFKDLAGDVHSIVALLIEDILSRCTENYKEKSMK